MPAERLRAIILAVVIRTEQMPYRVKTIHYGIGLGIYDHLIWSQQPLANRIDSVTKYASRLLHRRSKTGTDAQTTIRQSQYIPCIRVGRGKNDQPFPLATTVAGLQSQQLWINIRPTLPRAVGRQRSENLEFSRGARANTTSAGEITSVARGNLRPPRICCQVFLLRKVRVA